MPSNYSHEQQLPIESRVIEGCPICGSPNYTVYNVEDADVRTVYHCDHSHRFAWQRHNDQLVRYTDINSTYNKGVSDTVFKLKTLVAVSRTKRAAANLVSHDYDPVILIGRCPVCNSDQFS